MRGRRVCFLFRVCCEGRRSLIFLFSPLPRPRLILLWVEFFCHRKRSGFLRVLCFGGGIFLQHHHTSPCPTAPPPRTPLPQPTIARRPKGSAPGPVLRWDDRKGGRGGKNGAGAGPKNRLKKKKEGRAAGGRSQRRPPSPHPRHHPHTHTPPSHHTYARKKKKKEKKRKGGKHTLSSLHPSFLTHLDAISLAMRSAFSITSLMSPTM